MPSFSKECFGDFVDVQRVTRLPNQQVMIQTFSLAWTKKPAAAKSG
jgi:hypothetical protein